jgi:NAD(P)-dependent dehydrogenase (short-subunit alcohol dehydrogenase family)
MHIDLAGRVALVTGSTAGIGFAIARGLAHAGADVILNGRSAARVDAAASWLGDEVGGAVAVSGVVGDVSSAEGIDGIVNAVPAIDILVNNAAHVTLGTLFDTPDSEWLKSFECNVLGGVRLARAYLPGMTEKGWGRIVFVASESGVQIPSEMINYGVSKAAQIAASRAIAQSVAGSGVSVNTVLPGPTTSEIFTTALQGEVDAGRAADIEEAGKRYVAEFRPTSLLGRPPTPDEVAKMVVYLASDHSTATVGAALRVDGGVLANSV